MCFLSSVFYHVQNFESQPLRDGEIKHFLSGNTDSAYSILESLFPQEKRPGSSMNFLMQDKRQQIGALVWLYEVNSVRDSQRETLSFSQCQNKLHPKGPKQTINIILEYYSTQV